ncbi:hypothetical protein AB0M43_23660 [Longispora sp. NPDC051575]|uniref:hypothetical protein n=1 Tax=Longispora sp. NPDC051575 TaxID=3154943 RepID=UPI00341E6794
MARNSANTPRVRLVRHEIITVTPEVADTWLANNGHNRNVRQGRVDAYARDMAAGQWTFNGDPIRFATDGWLADGQHRLLALIAANVTLPFLVIWGLEATAQDTMDIGAHRSMGDSLALSGESNANTLAAIARRVIAYDQGRRNAGAVAPTHPEMAAYLARHPELRLAVDMAIRARKAIPAPPSSIAAAYHMCARVDVKRADFFFGDQVIDGLGLAPGDPARALRTRLSSDSLTGHRLGPDDVVRYAIAAWNHFRSGRTLTRLQAPKGGWSRSTSPLPR